MSLSWQQSLFDPVAATPAPLGELAVQGVRRLPLDERSWVDVARGWYPDHAGLFATLLDVAPWQQRARHLYDHRVLEPRLVAGWSGDALAALPAPLAEIRAAVSRHYTADFDSVLVNLYRDGRDGVAWHGDTVRHRLDEAVVVTVALGERRRFLLRPGTSGPAAHTLLSGEGDLVVMGGRCQHEWQHTVPKAVRAGARMSITLRHSLPLRG
jgi:alkylated DNA repair dioxygenase AlkB